jgi:hypothetical protein
MATQVVGASAVVVVGDWCKTGSMNLFLAKINIPLQLHTPL